jgi:NHL repeat
VLAARGPIISTIAGSGSAGFCGDGGPATSACLNFPIAVAVNGNNNLLIADTFNNRIRQFKSHGPITTVAGSGTSGFCGDNGPATSACLDVPEAVAVDDGGNLFIADTFNNRIRKANGSSTITTVGGNGTADFCGDRTSWRHARSPKTHGSPAAQREADILQKAGHTWIPFNSSGTQRAVSSDRQPLCLAAERPAAQPATGMEVSASEQAASLYRLKPRDCYNGNRTPALSSNG